MEIKKSDAKFLLFIAALLAGSAGHWFISGETAIHSFLRNLVVFIQLLLGLGMAVFALCKLYPKLSDSCDKSTHG